LRLAERESVLGVNGEGGEERTGYLVGRVERVEEVSRVKRWVGKVD